MIVLLLTVAVAVRGRPALAVRSGGVDALSSSRRADGGLAIWTDDAPGRCWVVLTIKRYHPS
jgi:hypothetical protein